MSGGRALTRTLGEATTGPARWVLAVAVFGAVMGASFSLGGVLASFGWFPRASIVVAVTLFIPALLRRRPGLAPFAPLGALAGWLIGLTLMFFPGTALLGFIPTTGTVGAALDLSAEASAVIMGSVAPAPTVLPMIFLAAAGLGFAALLIDTVAITVAVPAAGALGTVLIMLPAALMTNKGIGVMGFVGAAAGYLLLLGCCRWYAPEGKLRPGGTAAPSGALTRGAALGAAVVLLMAIVPATVPGFTQGSFPQGSRLNGSDGATRLDPMIALGADLRTQSSRINLTYLSNTNTAQYLRLSTLEDFTGKSWQPSPQPAGLGSSLDALEPAAEANAAVPRTETITEVTARSLDSEWLPAPLSPTQVRDLNGRWLWNPSTQTILGQGASTEDQAYTVRSEMPVLTPVLLEAATLPPRATLDPIFSTLPDDVPQLVRTTAQEVAGAAGTSYEKAMALQKYLRSDAFNYSLDTPAADGYDGSGMQVLAAFLENKSGYCVHFSAAMAVMARELGIPSRIAVGYAPGAANLEVVQRDGVTLFGYQAAGRDAHAWPELYFEGLGWVPFEPTPSRGSVPGYAQEETASGPDTENVPLPNRTTAPLTATAAAPTTTAAANAGAPAPPSGGEWLFRIGLGLLVLLLLGAPALVRSGGRRRRLALVRRGTGAVPGVLAWRELLATAIDYGYDTDRALTPALHAERIAAMLGTGAPPGLAMVRGAYEEAVYSNAPDGAGRDDLADAVETVHARLRTRATPWQRLRATLVPASFFTR